MRALLQRVSSGKVSVDDRVIAQIGRGLVILLGIGQEDGEEQATYLAEKIANLRIFEDEQGKTNLSILDVEGEAIVVSQFTLYADTHKGRRPSFIYAGAPEMAEPLVVSSVRTCWWKSITTGQSRSGLSDEKARFLHGFLSKVFGLGPDELADGADPASN